MILFSRSRIGGVISVLTLIMVTPAPPALAQTRADIAKAFQDADKSHDGRLDVAEFATLPDAIRAGAVDANHDGFYTLAELTPAGAQQTSLVFTRDDFIHAFQAADKNYDGKLDAKEFQTLPPAMREHAIDANGDGFYSIGELWLNHPSFGQRSCGFISRPSYRFWPTPPADLRPDDVVLQIDPATSRPAASRADPWDRNETIYDLKRVLKGAFKGRTVVVSSDINTCGNDPTIAVGADLLVGSLFTADDGAPILLSRRMVSSEGVR